MPTYLFKCEDCDHERELVTSIAKFDEVREEIMCEKCGGKMKVVINGTSFLLKGKGWAKDGYR